MSGRELIIRLTKLSLGCTHYLLAVAWTCTKIICSPS